MMFDCYDCGEKNRESRKFCKNCGAKLSQKCSDCDFINQADAKFCGGCGISVSAFKGLQTDDGERRQLTVMFCDLVNYSELAELFDPEELRDVLREFQQLVADVTMMYEGHIAKYIGDGLLIYFGHPHAHEDDARRSVLTGLGIIDEIEKLNTKLVTTHKIELGVRVGIHTGLVVVGQMGSGEAREKNAIVGETPNIAARIESLAKPGIVTISGDTNELTKGLFITEEKDFQALKGVSQKVKIYEVLSESAFLSEFAVRVQEGLTPMVGRSKELDFLRQSWGQAKKGLGQVVWLSGEAGVGKSRIINEFMSNISQDSQHLRLYYCSSVHSNTAFFPIISYLKRSLNLNKHDSNDKKYKILDNFFRNLVLPLDHVTSVFSTLLGIDPPKNSSKVTPENVKKMIIDSWFGLMIKMSEDEPLLLIFEDTHWIDPSTQELIHLLSNELFSHRILLVITSRPGYQLSIAENVPLQSLTLNRLDRDTSSMMIYQLGGQRRFPSELLNELVMKADGIPLFIEELTKAVMDSSLLKKYDKTYELSAPLSKLAIPNSLKDSLMARLDQLSAVKNVAQVAATIGRRFSAELLKSLSLHSSEVIDDSIKKLLKARLIFVSDELDRVHYQFSHALLQETAYQSLLKSTRKQYHGLIVEAIIKSFPGISGSEPEVMALHCTQAGKTELAVSYWLAAGKMANKTSSHEEAISHFVKGVDLLNTLPESYERSYLEFQIQVRLIVPLIAARSYTSSEVETTFTRALELSKRVDTSHEIFPVLHSRYSFYQVCGMTTKADAFQVEFFELAKHQKEPLPELESVGNRMRGSSQFLTGFSKSAEISLKESIKAYDAEKDKDLYLLYGHDSKVAALSYLGLNQWHQGKISEVWSCAKKATELSNLLGNSNTMGVSYLIANNMPLALLDEAEKVLDLSNKQIEVAKNDKMPLWRVTGMIFNSWALVQLGHHEKGMDQFESSLGAYNDMRVGQFRALITLLYAQCCMVTNKVVKGLSKLEEALQLSSVGGERWLDAELHRYIGELYLVKPSPDRDRAREEFGIALDISRQQYSLTQELRATMSLLKFASNDADIKSATEQLKSVHSKFDLTHNFKDLLKARKLLGIS